MNNIRNLIFIIVLICISIFLSIYTFEKSKYQDKGRNKAELFIDQLSLKPNKYTIWIGEDELKILTDALQNAKNYLEFGSGGSTYTSLLYSNANIVSVESDPEWLDYMRKWRLIRNNENKRLILYHANIGKTTEGGYPINKEKDASFIDYSKKVFKDFPRDYDVVLIDGRFRTACALQTILNTKDDVLILWHDFTNRPYYHEILKFLEIKKNTGTMVLLTKKKNINKKEVEKMFEKYQYDAR